MNKPWFISNASSFNEMKESKENLSFVGSHQLFIKTDSRLVKLKDEDILFIEAKGDYMLFKTREKGHIVHSTMKNVEAKLDPNIFLRIHRSFIINLNEIVDIEDSSVLIEKKVIPISKSYKDGLMKRINLL